MGVCFYKRGNLTEMVLSPMFIVLVVLALVFLPLLKYTTSVGQSSYYEREFYAKDLGLMISVLQAAPNDVVISYEQVKNVNVTIAPNYVLVHGFDVSPVKTPSKVTKFHIFPSSLEIVKTVLSPPVVTEDNGYVSPFEYSIVLNKNSNRISASSSTGMSLTPTPQKDSIDNSIDSFISALYEDNKIYIDVVYGSGKTSDGDDADVFGKAICNGIIIGNDYSSIDKCNLYNRATINDRINFAKQAEMIVVIYVNDRSNEKLRIYYHEGASSSNDKSKRISEFAVNVFSNAGYLTDKRPMTDLNDNEINQILTPDKVGFVIEIGNVDSLKKSDVISISEQVKNVLIKVSK